MWLVNQFTLPLFLFLALDFNLKIFINQNAFSFYKLFTYFYFYIQWLFTNHFFTYNGKILWIKCNLVLTMFMSNFSTNSVEKILNLYRGVRTVSVRTVSVSLLFFMRLWTRYMIRIVIYSVYLFWINVLLVINLRENWRRTVCTL